MSIFSKNKEVTDFSLKLELEDFPDFTKREIYESARLIEKLCEKYIKNDKIKLSFLKLDIKKIRRIYLVGEYSLALFGAYNFEVLIDIVSVAITAGEFMLSNPILDKNTLVVNIDNDNKVIKRCTQAGAKIINICDYTDSRNDVSLDFIEQGEFSTAAHCITMTMLVLIAVYLGEKNRVLTRLYVKIVIDSLKQLVANINDVLKENCIFDFSSKINPKEIICAGNNVDYALAYYFSRVIDSKCIYTSEIKKNEKEILLIASNVDFAGCSKNIEYKLIISPIACGYINENALCFDEIMPLLNPILISVMLSMLAYKIIKNNKLLLDK